MITVMTVMVIMSRTKVIAILLRKAMSPKYISRKPYTGTLRSNEATPAAAGVRLNTIPKTKAARIPGEINPWNS